jgi:hypothetical protein
MLVGMEKGDIPDYSDTFSIPEYRKLLGPAGEAMTDREVAHIRDVECNLADAIIEFWLRKKNAGKEDEPATQAQ